MKVKADASGLGRSKWYEYVIRFLFGGAVTALAGVVAKRFGPEVGGLFLAFPAIFPAAATLIEKHEQEKEDRAGEHGKKRGRAAAGVDAAGAAMGSLGLMAFAVIVWRGLPNWKLGLVLSGATLAWLLTSVLVWEFREVVYKRIRARYLRPDHVRANATKTPQPRLNAAAHHGPSTTRRFDE